MKITILDAHAANPGDLSWDEFKKLGDITVYERTAPEQVAERIGNSQAVFLNKIKIDESVLSQCPDLKYIGVLATGYNVIDLDACRKRNITVTNIPAYSTNSVAQHVFAFILNFTNLVQQHSDSVKNGDWVKCPDFCYWNNPLTELNGKTLGILGFGSIGQQVAKIGHAFGMNVIIHVHNEKSFTGGEKTVTLEELFRQSDFLSLHAPLTSETDKIVSKKYLSLMKNSAIIINTARGGLVNEDDITEFLNSEKIQGYAADVVLYEPMHSDCPLLKAKNCIITPHIAWAPKETRERLLKVAIDNINAYLNGKSINVVS